jgi:solute carrier family 25 S-adenosylmethionine transporter 26
VFLLVCQLHIICYRLPDDLASCSVRLSGVLTYSRKWLSIDNVKQKLQAGMFTSTSSAVGGIWQANGIGGFYRGYASTMMREIPFAFIQFPIYEALKRTWGQSIIDRYRASGEPVTSVMVKDPSRALASWQAAACGSVAGGIAAGLTTPFDVVKTRIMLDMRRATDTSTASSSSSRGPLTMAETWRAVYTEGGVPRMFAGVGPRVMWISAGGAVFFGMYEQSRSLFTK